MDYERVVSAAGLIKYRQQVGSHFNRCDCLGGNGFVRVAKRERRIEVQPKAQIEGGDPALQQFELVLALNQICHRDGTWQGKSVEADSVAFEVADHVAQMGERDAEMRRRTAGEAGLLDGADSKAKPDHARAGLNYDGERL